MGSMIVQAGSVAFEYDAHEMPDHSYDGERYVMKVIDNGFAGAPWYYVWDKQKRVKAGKHVHYLSIDHARAERDRLRAEAQ